MQRNSTWDMREYANNNADTWVTLHKETIEITQTDQYDYQTHHSIHCTSKSQVKTLIALLQAALLEYSES